MAEYPNQDKRWPSKAHFEQILTVGKGKGSARCQCWKSDRSQQCGKPAMPPYKACDKHGAKGAQANENFHQRKQFLDILGDAETVRELISKLHEIALKGNLEAIKYILDQLYGTAKATIVNEIADRDLFARMVRATAQHLTGQAFEEWLKDLESEMNGDSGSTKL
jgi:hypothetical protein